MVQLVKRQADTQAKFRVVFKQGVRPRRPFAVRAFAVRRGGQVAAVNGRAARRVRNQQTVAEQLRQQFDVRRFAAARASAGELKQRFLELRALYAFFFGFDVGLFKAEEELKVFPFVFP